MKLLLLCPHFEPDLHAATGEVMSKLVHALHQRGHRIDVVSSLPWYQHHDVWPEWRGQPWRGEKTSFGQILRVWPFPTDKTNIPARALGFGGFTGLATAAALTLGRPDVVMGMSPPIFLGDAAYLVARRWRVPVVFNVQDIFPDVAVDLGALSNERIISLARRHEKSLYRRVDSISVLSEDQAANVRAKIGPDQHQKVSIIHNFADTDRVHVVNRATEYRRRHGLENKQIVMYSGNVGLSQSFDLVRAAAEAFAHRPEVHFVINGEGAARPAVDHWAAKHTNVTVSDFAPRDKVSDVLGSADLHLILLKGGLARSSTPSKLYGILASGRPTLASIDVGSEVSLSLERADAGRSVPPDDQANFLRVLKEMLDEPKRLQEQGRNGRRYVEHCLTPDAQAESFEKLFGRLTDQARCGDQQNQSNWLTGNRSYD